MVTDAADPDDEWRDEWRDLPSTATGETGPTFDCVDPDVTERVLLHDKEELRRLWGDHGARVAHHETVREIDGDDAKIARYMADIIAKQSSSRLDRAFHELGCRVIPKMLNAAAIDTEPIGKAVEAPRDPPYHISVVGGPEDPSVQPLLANEKVTAEKAREALDFLANAASGPNVTFFHAGALGIVHAFIDQAEAAERERNQTRSSK